MKKSIKVGDVFAIKIEKSKKYYFGRVLFDVKEQYNNSGQEHNYLDWYNECVLIETYKYIDDKAEINEYDIAISSVFIPKKELLKTRD